MARHIGTLGRGGAGPTVSTLVAMNVYGVVWSGGNIYAADYARNTIYRITPAGISTILAGPGTGAWGHVDATGTAGRFDTPWRIAADAAANIIVPEVGGHSAVDDVRVVAPSGAVTTLASGFTYPIAVAVDAGGYVWLVDFGTNQLYKLDPTSGAVLATVGSGAAATVDGTGAGASFNNPQGVVVHPNGNLYVAEFSTIRKVTLAGVVTTVAGDPAHQGYADGTGAAAKFHWPTAMAPDAGGDLLVCDSNNFNIRRVTLAGVVTTYAGSTTHHSGSTDGPAATALFNDPEGLAIDPATGIVYVGDDGNGIRVITP